jgi:hypothetical protein
MMNQIRCFVGAGYRPARIFLLLIVLLPSAIALRADIHISNSGSQADVQATINAAHEGDTVTIPQGTWEWSTPYGYSGSNWKAAIQIVKKSIYLKGTGIDKTIIVNRVPFLWCNAAIHIEGQAQKAVRISNLTLTDISTEYCSRFILIDGTCNWRIGHCKFSVSPNKFGSYRYIIELYSKGLIDNCTLNNSLIDFNDVLDGVTSWNTPISLGTADAAFVEDCTFFYDGTAHGQMEDFIDGQAGARVVIRHNQVTNALFHFHGIESGANRGIFSYELYENTLIDDGTVNDYRKGYMRGGTGVVFNNSWVGPWPVWSPFYVVHQCVYLQKDPNNHNCDGEKWCYSYPCKDQIGRTSDADHSGAQDLCPLFAWNNKCGATAVILQVQDDPCFDCFNYIKENRDYYNNTVSFNSLTGEYTASYKGDDNNTKQWIYKPYNYPHPFRVYGPLADETTQTITLTAGWNWVSFNVLPADLSLNSIFSGIFPQVEQVKTQTQSVIRSNGNWKGDLANMNGVGQYKMYKVKVSTACTLTVTGTAALSASPIQLGGGWNWVAYLPTTAMPIATALASISGQVQEVKSLTHSATYNGTTWSGALMQLEPCQGYAIKMSSPWTLAYPGAAQGVNHANK